MRVKKREINSKQSRHSTWENPLVLDEKHKQKAEFFLLFPANEVDESLEGQMGSGWGEKKEKRK